MKPRVLALTTLLIITASAVPAMAQTRTYPQDFFERGREQFEREVQDLTEESPEAREVRLEIRNSPKQKKSEFFVGRSSSGRTESPKTQDPK